MKQQHSASSLPPSRLCRILFLALTLKLLVLGGMVFEPALPDIFSSGNTPGTTSGGFGVALAAEDGAGAPPAIAPQAAGNTLPQTAGEGTTPPASQTATGMSPNTASNMDASTKPRTLPSISGSKMQSNATGNGTQQGTGTGNLNRELLTRKQEELNRKEQELLALQSDISDKLEKMQLLENRLNIMMKDAKDTSDAKFKHLVDVLSNMKAKSAAQVLESLDQRTAVKVLAGMRGRQAGEILTFVRPEIAASLTEALTRMQLPLE